MNAQLTFNQVSFDTVSNPQDTQQIWITSADLANALGYARTDSVSRIYDRNSDEFTNAMSQTVNLTVSGNINDLQHKSVRIFSLRGCHLIAMFAKTAVAKAFRKWVLDLIESEANRHHMLTTADERTGLRQATDALVGKYGLLYPDAYRLVHQRFNVTSIDELTIEQVAQATEYLYRLTLGQSGDSGISEANLKVVISHFDWCHSWFTYYENAIRSFSPRTAASISDHFDTAWVYLRDFGKTFGMQLLNRERMRTYPWHASCYDQQRFKNFESVYLN